MRAGRCTVGEHSIAAERGIGCVKRLRDAGRHADAYALLARFPKG